MIYAIQKKVRAATFYETVIVTLAVNMMTRLDPTIASVITDMRVRRG